MDYYPDSYLRDEQITARGIKPWSRPPTCKGFEQNYRNYYQVHGDSDLRLIIAGQIVHMHTAILQERALSFLTSSTEAFTRKLWQLSADFTKNNCAWKNLMTHLYSSDEVFPAVVWPRNQDISIFDWLVESVETHKLATFFELDDFAVAIEQTVCAALYGGGVDLEYLRDYAFGREMLEYLASFTW